MTNHDLPASQGESATSIGYKWLWYERDALYLNYSSLLCMRCKWKYTIYSNWESLRHISLVVYMCLSIMFIWETNSAGKLYPHVLWEQWHS